MKGSLLRDGGVGLRCFCNVCIASPRFLRDPLRHPSPRSCAPGTLPAAETGTCWSPTTSLPTASR